MGKLKFNSGTLELSYGLRISGSSVGLLTVVAYMGKGNRST